MPDVAERKYVTDPRNLVTGYTRNGLGNLSQQTSPDTGATSLTYDAAGNVLTRTDAKGQVATYTYDILNRVGTITWTGGTATPQAIAYQYDTGVNGIGHLTQITDSTGTTGYAYNQKGRLTSETGAHYGGTYTTGYAYDAQGRLTGIAYPSGRTINYTFDAQGRVASIGTTFNAVTTPLASNIVYEPFGGVHGFSYGDGVTAPVQTYTRNRDQDGRIASYTLNGTRTMSVLYDAASQIVTVNDSANPTTPANYTYDPMSRLTGYTQGTASQGFGYDVDGNRATQTIGATNTTYAFGTTSNWLSGITVGAGTQQPVTHDAIGATTADNTKQYAYDLRGRLIQTTTALGVVNYEINALGLRLRKQVPYAATDTEFHYDRQGHLIAEGNTGTTTFNREYVYLGGQPIATLTNNAGATQVYYIQADHLNTPRVITDINGNVVWFWDNVDPYGNNAPNENPSNLGTFRFPLRYTGQYDDIETGLYYNVFRTYDPANGGRYLESDPIGLGGGINTYAYVGGNPLWATDPLGLAEAVPSWCSMCHRSVPPPIIVPPGSISPPLSFPGTTYPITTMTVDVARVDTKEKKKNCECKDATEANIRAVLQDDPMMTTQTAGVSAPVIQAYVNYLKTGQVPPPIGVWGGEIIVDGNHRYIASRLCDKEPPMIPSPISDSQIKNAYPIRYIPVDTVDWGNR